MTEEEHWKQIEKEFEFLSQDPSIKAFFDLVCQLKNISIEDKELLVDQFRWLGPKQLLPEKWINETLTICKKLLSGNANIVEEGMFFIRLYGILDEFPSAAGKYNEFTRQICSQYRDYDEFLDIEDKIKISLETIRKGLTEIEKIAIEFFRLQEAHINPVKFQVRDAKGGKRKRIYGSNGKPTIAVVKEVMRYMRDNYPSVSGYDIRQFAEKLAAQIIEEVYKIDQLLKRRSQLDVGIF